MLDLLDKRIIYGLDLNARISSTRLAKKLRKSKDTVNFRINRLIKEGYIKGFYTVFNTSKLGWYYYKAYIKFKNITPEKEKELLNWISKQDHIAYLASIEGYYDCIFLVMVKNAKNMLDFLEPFMKIYGDYILEKEIVTFLTTHRINQRFLFEGKEKRDWCYPIILEDYKLDEINKKILNIISTNAKIPLVGIAKNLNVDHKIIKYRLSKLEKENIILAYVTSPNFDKLGLHFIQVNISLKNPSSSVKKSVINYFDDTNKCLFAIELLGKYDLTIEIHVENNEKLKKIIDGFREKFISVYNDYDISTINKEYVVVWGSFGEKNANQRNNKKIIS